MNENLMTNFGPAVLLSPHSPLLPYCIAFYGSQFLFIYFFIDISADMAHYIYHMYVLYVSHQ